MDKKNYLWIGIALFVIVIIVLLVVKSTGTPAQNTPANQNTPAATGSETKQTDKTNTVASNTPNEASATDSLPLSKETILTADGKSFTPKTITVKTGEKVFMTFAATDDARHTFNFIDQDLSFIFVMFSKAEGAKSITFPAPKAGTYTYFVDDKANTGKLIVE